MEPMFPLPEPAHEVRLAHWLLGRQSDLELRVLEALVGEPRRFRDLRAALVHGTSDTPLTRALRRLGDRALIRQGLILEDPDDPRYYALTSLGVIVLFKTHEFRPFTSVLDEARRAGVFGA